MWDAFTFHKRRGVAGRHTDYQVTMSQSWTRSLLISFFGWFRVQRGRYVVSWAQYVTWLSPLRCIKCKKLPMYRSELYGRHDGWVPEKCQNCNITWCEENYGSIKTFLKVVHDAKFFFVVASCPFLLSLQVILRFQTLRHVMGVHVCRVIIH